MVRTWRESDRGEKWKTCWRCRDQQRARRMAHASAEKLEHTGPAEKKRVASVPKREQLASMPESPLLTGKKQSRLPRAPDRKKGIPCQISKENSSRVKKKDEYFFAEGL